LGDIFSVRAARGCGMPDLTSILDRVNRGEAAAYEQLVPLVYDELRRRAALCLRGQRDRHTLQPTALVNEAYMKLAGAADTSWEGRRHFYNAAAEAMRQILASYGRRKAALKRGGPDGRRVPLDGVEPAHCDGEDEQDWEALDRALDELRGLDERRYRVVMLRYFTGLTDAQVSQTLEVSEKTVERDWAAAKVFLAGRMAEFHGNRP
jgi:RNA polymerase sigma-70 factor, ECF subfamily